MHVVDRNRKHKLFPPGSKCDHLSSGRYVFPKLLTTFFCVIRSGFSFHCLPGGLSAAPCATSMGRAVYVYVDYVGIGQSGKWQSVVVRLEWFRRCYYLGQKELRISYFTQDGMRFSFPIPPHPQQCWSPRNTKDQATIQNCFGVT